MKIKTQTVRKEMLARDLKGIIDLPNYDDNQLVEVAVYPTEKKEKLPPEEIEALLDRITGAILYT